MDVPRPGPSGIGCVRRQGRFMKYATFAAFACTLMLVQQAQAMSVTNRDDDAAMVTIIQGDQEMMYEVAPGETLGDLCLEGCTAIFGNGEEVSLTGKETIQIEDDKPIITK